MATLEELQQRSWRAITAAQMRTRARLTELADLPVAWLDILFLLHDNDGSAPQSELVAQLELSQSWTSRVVDEMRERGLVDRSRMESNRRSAVVQILPAGEAALARSLPSYNAFLASAFGGLGAPELERLTELLERVSGEDVPAGEAPAPRRDVLQLGESLIALRGSAIEATDARALRDTLEVPVIEEAALYSTPADEAELHSILSELSRSMRDPDAYLAINFKFHRALANIVRNELLRTVYLLVLQTIEDAYERIIVAENQFEYFGRSLLLHADILNAVVTHDVDAARAAAIEHRAATLGPPASSNALSGQSEA